jgi:hypothetical protein
MPDMAPYVGNGADSRELITQAVIKLAERPEHEAVCRQILAGKISIASSYSPYLSSLN